MVKKESALPLIHTPIQQNKSSFNRKTTLLLIIYKKASKVSTESLKASQPAVSQNDISHANCLRVIFLMTTAPELYFSHQNYISHANCPASQPASQLARSQPASQREDLKAKEGVDWRRSASRLAKRQPTLQKAASRPASQGRSSLENSRSSLENSQPVSHLAVQPRQDQLREQQE